MARGNALAFYFETDGGKLNRLEQIEDLKSELQRYAPTYLKELNVAKGDPEGFVCCLDPDHDDKNPSMHWYREAGIYHCFSCSSTFDIFKIASVFEGKPTHGKEFILENVFYLAQRFGVSYAHIDIEITGEDLEKIKQYDIMRVLEEHVVKNANQEYLERRKITKETAKDLSIGGVNFDELVKELEAINAPKELYEKMGIDKFKLNKNKLVLIIKDNNGRPVSFVSREMVDQLTAEEKEFYKQKEKEAGKMFEEKEEIRAFLKNELPQLWVKANTPKYINGKASLIYDKSKIIYGFSAVRKKINKHKHYFILEGYLDFVTAYQAGIYNVGALGSASFTDELVDFLEDTAYINKIAIALDNDVTGEKRTKSLIERLSLRKNLEKKYAVAFYKTEYKDVDEAINAGITDLKDIFEINTLFQYNLKYQIEHCEDERAIIDLMIPAILQEDSRLTREEMVNEMMEYINTFSKETVLREMNYREDYKKQNIAKKFDKEIDKFKTELLLEPSAVKTIVRRFGERLNTIHEDVYKKKTNLFESTLTAVRTAEEQKADRTFKKITTNFSIFDEANVTKTNVITICGRANSFKTSLFVNLAVNILNNNENVFVYYYSTDDPLEKIINDFVACKAGIAREYCADPLFHKELGKEVTNSEKAFKIYQLYIKTLNEIENWIKEKKLIIKQSSEVTTWNQFEDTLLELSEEKALNGIPKVAIIDSVNKIEVPGIQEDNQRISYLSERTKKAAEAYGFTIFQNIELKKIPDNYLVSVQDLRGSARATSSIMKSYCVA